MKEQIQKIVEENKIEELVDKIERLLFYADMADSYSTTKREYSEIAGNYNPELEQYGLYVDACFGSIYVK